MRCSAFTIILWRLVKGLSLLYELKLNSVAGISSFISSDIPFLLETVWLSLSVSLSHTHTHSCIQVQTILSFFVVIEKECWVEAGKRRINLSDWNMTGRGYQGAW